MTDQPDDPIIDACLDEVLGGQTPPNLTVRILRAWDGAEKETGSVATGRSSAIGTADLPASDPATPIRIRDSKRVSSSRHKSPTWLAMTASLAVVGVGVAWVWFTWNTAEQGQRLTKQVASPEVQPPAFSRTPDAEPPDARPIDREIPESPSEANARQPRVQSQPTPEARSLAAESEGEPDAGLPVAEVVVPDERPAPLSDEQIVHAINELIRDRWQSEGTSPAEPAADKLWCRRVYGKLIGREPDPEELSSFVTSRSAAKRQELVDLLLTGETYIEEFAAHWGQTWTNILLASSGQKTNRDGLEQYLRRAFGERKPFDETAYELLTATGSGKVGTPNYNGAANYLLAHSDRERVYAGATAHASRTFLGLSLDCAQCHVDWTWSGIEQQQFWELNAFFRQLEWKRDPEGGLLLADADIRHRGSNAGDGETFYPLLDGTLKAAYPVFVDGTEIPRTPGARQLNRRELLARFVTRSEQFRQAMANRFWFELFGVGFTIPPDNIGPHNPPSHPELLAKLGGQFAAHDYDVRALIRWIVLSEPFGLSDGDVSTDDQIRGKLVFDRFPRITPGRQPVLERLQTAGELYASIRTSARNGANSARITTIDPGAIPQALSDVDKRLAAVATEARRLSKSTVYGSYLLESDMSLEQKLQHMFYATLRRAPTKRELESVQAVLGDGAAVDQAALEYVWWALASSQEAR